MEYNTRGPMPITPDESFNASKATCKIRPAAGEQDLKGRVVDPHRQLSENTGNLTPNGTVAGTK